MADMTSPFSTHQMLILLPGTKNGFVQPAVDFTGDPLLDREKMAPFISGVPVCMKDDLTIDIADGNLNQVMGLLVYDGAGTSPFDGIGGADQSGVLTYVYGLATVQMPTRVLDTAGTFAVGKPVFAGAGAKKGLIVDATPSGVATVIGTVISNINAATDGLMIQMAI